MLEEIWFVLILLPPPPPTPISKTISAKNSEARVVTAEMLELPDLGYCGCCMYCVFHLFLNLIGKCISTGFSPSIFPYKPSCFILTTSKAALLTVCLLPVSRTPLVFQCAGGWGFRPMPEVFQFLCLLFLCCLSSLLSVKSSVWQILGYCWNWSRLLYPLPPPPTPTPPPRKYSVFTL